MTQQTLYRCILLSVLIPLFGTLTACVPPDEQTPANDGGEQHPPEGDSPGQNKCDLYKIFREANPGTRGNPYRASFDTPSDEPPVTVTKEADGSRTLVIQAGFDTFSKPQVKSMRYFDLDTDKIVDISDKDAIEKNKDWDFGIRAFELYTNGGPYPGGDIEVAITPGHKNNVDQYPTFSKEDANKLTYVSEEPVDSNCKPIMKGQAGYLLLASTPNQLNAGRGNPFEQNYWFRATPFHQPHLIPKDDIYVLRKKSNKEWMYKLKVDRNPGYDKTTKAITFTIHYKKL